MAMELTRLKVWKLSLHVCANTVLVPRHPLSPAPAPHYSFCWVSHVGVHNHSKWINTHHVVMLCGWISLAWRNVLWGRLGRLMPDILGLSPGSDLLSSSVQWKIITVLISEVCELIEVININFLAQCLAQGKHLINSSWLIQPSALSQKS